MKLIKTVTSSFNCKCVYGVAGSPVKLISDYDTALIVEDESGNRFPVNREDVSEDENITLDDAPSTASINTISIKGVGARTKKATPIEQQQLF